jgi:hypothetical protein
MDRSIRSARPAPSCALGPGEPFPGLDYLELGKRGEHADQKISRRRSVQSGYYFRGTAFEGACRAPETSNRSDVTKEMIATKIIQLAQHGETDPNVLREMVLSEFGLPRLRQEP